MQYRPERKGKKWQADYIAPLQPLTLAVFRPWGSSAGAGRVRPAAAKIRRGRIWSKSYQTKFHGRLIRGSLPPGQGIDRG